MNGPFGLLQSLADGMKLMFKEDFTPMPPTRSSSCWPRSSMAIPADHCLRGDPAWPGWCAVPFTDITTPLQVTDLPVSVLFIVAVASIGVYGIVLAGWSSRVHLLAARRVALQRAGDQLRGRHGSGPGSGVPVRRLAVHLGDRGQAGRAGDAFSAVPLWFAVQLLPSFVIYLISMVGETNRAPFDLPEAEGELVGGFHTEYSSMRFAMFFMAEYMNMITVSALAATLFLGGWHAPLPFNLVARRGQRLVGLLWFVLKVLIMLFIFVWLRGTLPRLRYDQFMRFGWRWLIPISLVWTLMIAILRMASARDGSAANRILDRCGACSSCWSAWRSSAAGRSRKKPERPAKRTG